MNANRVDAVRSWAQRNEPLFRLAEVGLVFVFGCILTVYISWQQTRVAEAELKLARAQAQPNVEVSHWSDLNSATLQVFYRREDVRNLSAHATLFVEQIGKNGNTRRVQVRNFYRKGRVLGSGRLAEFPTSVDAETTANLKFLWAPNEVNELNELGEKLASAVASVNLDNKPLDNDQRPGMGDSLFSLAWNNNTRLVCCYVRLEYENAIGERVGEEIVVQYPTLRFRQVEEEPSYDETIDLDNFKGESGVDFAAVNKDLERFFAGMLRL